MRKRSHLVVALVGMALAGVAIGRHGAAQAEKKPVMIWHTISFKADAEADRRSAAKGFMEDRVFPMLMKQKAAGLIRFYALKATTEKVMDPDYRQPAEFALVEVWKDAESARRFWEKPPAELADFLRDAKERDAEKLVEHQFSIYEEVSASPLPAAAQ